MNAQLRPQLPGRRLLCNALRFLAIDAVERAGNGHPGMPMGMAEIAEALWRGYLKHDPADPHWVDRDRFVLSNGHGSMLLYALLHLTGYDLPLEELKRFRQLHSKTPGHPEFGVTPGVETTTGPLGQGLANAVGMALAESLLAAEFNRPGHAIVDHRTWVFVGDGCLMEGISHEACSLAGTPGLSKLVAIYDDNGISIDGRVEHWFADDTPRRFEAYGWRVIREGRLDGRGVVAGDLAYDTPAVGLKAPRGVIGEPMLDAAVDADAVVVVDRHQFRQPQCSGERARFVADAFHQTTVTHEYPRSVVDDRVARPIEFRGQELLGERHADRIGQPLPEWARGGFHPGRDSDLRMSGSLAVQLTKALQLFQRQRITGEVEQRIQQHRTVTIGKHEAVAVGPERIGGIVLQVPPPEHLGDVRHPQ